MRKPKGKHVFKFDFFFSVVLFGDDAVRVVVLFVRLNNRNYVEVHMNWLFFAFVCNENLRIAKLG